MHRVKWLLYTFFAVPSSLKIARTPGWAEKLKAED